MIIISNEKRALARFFIKLFDGLFKMRMYNNKLM